MSFEETLEKLFGGTKPKPLEIPPIDRMACPKTCFLCGVPLDRTNWSAEHVFPKWLSRRVTPTSTQIALLNGQLLPWHRVKCPCCATCNTAWLSPLESRIAQGFEKLHQAADYDTYLDVSLWCMKVMYGLQYMQATYRDTVQDPNSGYYISDDRLRALAAYRFILQSVAKQTQIHGLLGTLFIFELTDEQNTFGYADEISGHAMIMRAGHLGITFALDHGVHGSGMLEIYKSILPKRLTTDEFFEFGIAFLYNSTLVTEGLQMFLGADETLENRTLIFEDVGVERAKQIMSKGNMSDLLSYAEKKLAVASRLRPAKRS